MKEKFLFKYSKILIGISLILLLCTTAFICDKEVTVSPPPSPAPTGFLQVQSNPEGFSIYLNDRNTGSVTPDSLIYLDYGTYKVTLKKNYFRDTSIIVNVREGIRVNTSIDILSNPLMYGSLNVTSNPSNSEIFLNDSATAHATPSIINHLVPGLYQVRLKKSGYRDGVLNNVAIESNSVRAVYSELQDTTVWVDFQVSNSDIPTNVLTCITADLNGTKWIGTIEYGLLKFDGSTFTEFNKDNSPLPNNSILCLTVDPANRLWIGTDNGLAVLENGNWNVYTKNNSGLPINSIKSLAAESSNLLWIGTSVGLVKYDGNWQVYTINSNITNWINTIAVDQNHTKWVGVNDTTVGILSFDGTSFTNYPIENYGYLTKSVDCSAVSPSGGIWFGCNQLNGVQGGLSYFNGGSFTNVLLSSFQVLTNIFIDNSDEKWISTSYGLYKITGTSQITHYYTINSPLTSNDLKGAVKDTEGNLWIATSTAGLVKFKGAN